jgi:hypothetical protein
MMFPIDSVARLYVDEEHAGPACPGECAHVTQHCIAIGGAIQRDHDALERAHCWRTSLDREHGHARVLEEIGVFASIVAAEKRAATLPGVREHCDHVRTRELDLRDHLRLHNAFSHPRSRCDAITPKPRRHAIEPIGDSRRFVDNSFFGAERGYRERVGQDVHEHDFGARRTRKRFDARQQVL